MNLEKELQSLLNKNSAETGFDKPDLLFARFLISCLKVWNECHILRS